MTEAGRYGALFLSEVAELSAAGPDHAAACYGAEHDLMWVLCELAGGIGAPEAYRALGDPLTRRTMADIAERAREEDARAARRLERAPGDF